MTETTTGTYRININKLLRLLTTRYRSIIFVTVLIACISGCTTVADSDNVESAVPIVDETPVSSIKPTPTKKPIATPIPSAQTHTQGEWWFDYDYEVMADYFGTWEAVDWYTVGIYGMDEERIESYIGSQVVYSESEIVLEHTKSDKPLYKVKEGTSSELFWDMGKSLFTDHGIETNTTFVVQIYCIADDGKKINCTEFGSEIMIKDLDTIIIGWNGVSFVMNRV